MGFWVFACGLLIHRSLFAGGLRFNVENNYVQDYQLIYELVAVVPFYYIPETLVFWRQHGQDKKRDLVDSQQAANQERCNKLLFEGLLTNHEIAWFHPSSIVASELIPESRHRADLIAHIDLVSQAMLNHGSFEAGNRCIHAAFGNLNAHDDR